MHLILTPVLSVKNGLVLLSGASSPTTEKVHTLAVCFKYGAIYFMNNYDDVCPKVVHSLLTGEKTLKMAISEKPFVKSCHLSPLSLYLHKGIWTLLKFQIF